MGAGSLLPESSFWYLVTEGSLLLRIGKAGVANLLAFLNHSGERIVLDHILNLRGVQSVAHGSHYNSTNVFA